jgi:hypothetical protein
LFKAGGGDEKNIHGDVTPLSVKTKPPKRGWGGFEKSLREFETGRTSRFFEEQIRCLRAPPILRIVGLAANAQTLDEVLVTCLVFAFGVIEKLTTQSNHFQKATATVVVFFVGLEVLSQCRDAGCKDCNLNFGRTCVAFFGREFFHQTCFFFNSNRHRGLLVKKGEWHKPGCRPAGPVEGDPP